MDSITDKVRSFVITLLTLVCFVSACTTDTGNSGTGASTPAGTLYVTFTVDNNIATRASLESSDNIQQVSTVFLYIFRGTGQAAECVACEDVGWTRPTGPSAVQYYKVKTQLVPGEDYTLLGVGVDDDALTTYGFPNAVPVGCTLADAKAKLADGMDYDAMASAPIFAGTATATSGEKGFDIQVQVTMIRRVAGILCYLKNIPYRMLYDGNDVQVDRIRLVLHQNQNTSMLLPKPISGTDTGANPSTDDNSRILAEFAMKDTYGNYYKQSTEGNYYEIPAVSTDDFTTIGNSLFRGLFMLPVTNESANATLTLQALDNVGNVLNTWTLRDGATGSVFSILPNHLYSIGIKTSAANMNNEDSPLDLQYNSVIVLVPDFEARYELTDGGMEEY